MTSRAYDEYAAFFALDVESLRGRRVLDCCAGLLRERLVVDATGADPGAPAGRPYTSTSASARFSVARSWTRTYRPRAPTVHFFCVGAGAA